jgi:chorismate synthase
MAGNSFGKLFRITTAGVSHGPGYVCVVDGCPPGIPLETADLLPDLERRRPGQSKLTTQRNESDTPEIWSGIHNGRTDGTSISIVFRNTDQRSNDYNNIAKLYRPGHADFTFDAKYGHRDPRGGGRSSARETICRVAAGAIAKKVLAQLGVRIIGWVNSVGEVTCPPLDPEKVTLEAVEATPIRCPHPESASRMISLIDAVRMDCDSIGGTATLAALGVPPGWGEPVFDKLKADLAKAMLSLPAVTGFEYGSGFEAARMRGSEHNDRFVPRPDRPWGLGTEGNHHGGMLGGISSGETLVTRVAIKPTSSIARAQKTVDQEGKPGEILVKGRHDPCLLPRFIPMGEAMMAIVLVDHHLRHKAQCGK